MRQDKEKTVTDLLRKYQSDEVVNGFSSVSVQVEHCGSNLKVRGLEAEISRGYLKIDELNVSVFLKKFSVEFVVLASFVIVLLYELVPLIT